MNKKAHNNRMHSDSKKRRSFLALLFASGDARRYLFNRLIPRKEAPISHSSTNGPRPMPKIEYDVFFEAAGNRPLTSDKIQVGFKHIENGEITHSESFSVPELEAHIERLDLENADAAIYREALNKAKDGGS